MSLITGAGKSGGHTPFLGCRMCPKINYPQASCGQQDMSEQAKVGAVSLTCCPATCEVSVPSLRGAESRQ